MTSCGRHWPNCPAWRESSPKAAATSSTSSRTCRPSSPRCATARSRSFCSRTGWPRLTSVLNDNRSDLDAALSDLSVAMGEVQRFVAGTRNQTAEQIQRLGNLTQVLVDHKMAFENVLHITPNAIANFENIYYPNGGSVTGAFSLVNFSNPVQAICGMIGAVENTTAPETAKLCAQYLGPALRLRQLQRPPVADQPLPAAGNQSGPDHLHRPEAGAGRRGAGRRARAAADGVGLHRRGRYPTAPGLEWAAEHLPGHLRASARQRRTFQPVDRGDQPRAASRAAAHHLQRARAVRRPSTGCCSRTGRRRRADPNAPLLPAEGTPPS